MSEENSTQYIFKLTEIDVIKILEKYYEFKVTDEDSGIVLPSLMEDESECKELNVTSLLHETSDRYITWLDPLHSEVKMWIHMKDFTTGSLPITTDKPCWWCRESFQTHPIGAPLKYHPHVKEGKIYDVCKCNLDKLNFNSETNDFFETEGIFCSFPCVKAWISEKAKTDVKYRHSGELLTQLYYKLYGKIEILPKAPSWKLINKWGGHLTINEFRNTYCTLHYIFTESSTKPFMYSIGHYIEETRKL